MLIITRINICCQPFDWRHGLVPKSCETFEEVYAYAYKGASSEGLRTRRVFGIFGKITGCHSRNTYKGGGTEEEAAISENFITQ